MKSNSSRNLILVSLLVIALLVGVPLFRRARIQNSGVALCTAAANRRTAEALSLIDNGAPVNFADPKQFGFTPLHAAAVGGDDAVISALLAHGAKIEATNEDDSTPLAYAATAGQPSAVKLLLSKGANPQARDKFGHTPLQRAESFLRVRRPTARQKVVYLQVVAILEAAEHQHLRK